MDTESINGRRNDWKAVSIVVIILSILTAGIVFAYRNYAPEPATYEECIAQNGNQSPAVFPGICTTKSGKQFTQPLTSEEQELVNPPSDVPSITAIPGWETFSDEEYSISIQYPPEWKVLENSQLFQQGDLLGVQIIGKTQSLGTEIYDGAMLGVAKPLENITETAEEWARANYSQNRADETQPLEFSKETINGIEFDKVFNCGLGCFTYYHVKRDNRLYGIVTFSEGPDKELYETQIRQMLESFRLI